MIEVSKGDGLKARRPVEPSRTKQLSLETPYVQDCVQVLSELELAVPLRDSTQAIVPTGNNLTKAQAKSASRSCSRRLQPVDDAVSIVEVRGQVDPRAVMISLQAMKTLAVNYPVDHPLRILLAGEPDEISRDEYVSKLPGWFRLVRSRED